MGNERGRRPHAWPNAVGFVLLLAVVISLRGCTSDTTDWQSSREIIVKLRETGSRLRTVGSDQAALFLYGADTLTIFDGLPHRDSLEIRQSFPEFSRRWQDERRWRAGRHDSTALAVLPGIVATCPSVSTGDSVAILNLISRWDSDLAAAQAGSAGVRVVVETLGSGGAVSPADSLAVLNLLRDILADGAGIGLEDSLGIAAIRRLLENCPLGTPDSLAILGFADRLEEDGGVAGISDVAIPAMVQLIEGTRPSLRESLAVVSYIRLLYGDDAFGRRDPPAAVDLFFRIRVKDPSLDVEDLLRHIRALPEVEYAVRAVPDAPVAPALPRPARASPLVHDQPYLKSEASGGVDAYYSWGAPGGKGEKVMIMVVDASWEKHDDLPAFISPYSVPVSSDDLVPRNPPGFPEASKNSIRHGTQTLGVLAAGHEGTGVMGICPEAKEILFTTTIRGGVYEAIDEILQDPRLRRGDVLVVEAQQKIGDLTADKGCCAPPPPSGPNLLPAEANPDVYAAIQWATSADYGVVVVEAAGNGGRRLVRITDDRGSVLWDPENNSGAIIVGAGNGVDRTHARIVQSNYGERVDCQGWGGRVATTTIRFDADNSPKSDYTEDFGGTSSATAIVGGVAASLQSAYVAAMGYPISPEFMRWILRDGSYGSPQPESEAEEQRIGPLPNLKKLLTALEIEGGVN